MEQQFECFSSKVHWHVNEYISRSGCFFIGGETKTDSDGNTFYSGQMYTEVYVPKEIRHKYPVVMVHGAAQTALTWVYTADYRPGWLYYFLGEGYVVYLVDQPARGRSSYNAVFDGETENWSLENVTNCMLGTQASISPKSLPHTQFPQDQVSEYYKNHVSLIHDRSWAQRVVSNALIALLDEIGPAILLTHSQSGPFGWVVADQRPNLVKGIVAVEPTGPAFPDTAVNKESCTISHSIFVNVPLQFSPPVSSDNPVKLKWFNDNSTYHDGGWIQAEPLFMLPNLAHIPCAILTSETSIHVKYDYLTAYALNQCGVSAEHFELGSIGIHGNGHMMMVEKNSDQIAEFICGWLTKHEKLRLDSAC